jgi:signal peptidase I
MSESSELINHAKQAIRVGDREKAWRLLHQYISRQPEDIDAWLMLGGLARQGSRMVYLRRAEAVAPNDNCVRKAIFWASEELKLEDKSSYVTKQIKTIRERIQHPQPVAQIAVDDRIQPESVLQSRKPVSSASISSGSVQVEQAEQSKAGRWLKTVVTVIVVGIFLVLLGIGITALITGSEPRILGYQMMVVTSGSMEPIFKTGSIIVVNTRADQDYKVGDVVMFTSAEDPGRNVTHRIININEEDGIRYYQTQGDNNDAPDQTQITVDHIRGKYVNVTIPFLGYFFSFIKSKKGILLMIALVGVYLVVTQAFRIRQLMKEEE